MPSILSNLRRSRERSRSKTSSATSPSKAKPLDILPGLTELSEQEEDERTYSAPSSVTYVPPRPQPQTLSPVDLSAKKRDSRRVVLTGVENLSFDDFFALQTPRPAPSPPNARPSSAHAQSPLDNINLRFSGLSFPFSRMPTTPDSLHSIRSSSPTPSCASTASASTVSSAASTSSACARTLTPPTSDDECQDSLTARLTRAPTVKSHRGTIGYVPGPRKQRSASEKSFVDLHWDEEEAAEESEDASWFAQDISDSYMLSPTEREPPALSVTPAGSLSRASGKSRFSKPLPVDPRLSIQSMYPSTQLDPAFPAKRKSYIPSRPPPPPPIRIIDVDCGTNVFIAPPTPEETKCSPTMEEKTEELLVQLATAALTATSLSVPAGPSRLSCISNPTTPTSTTPQSCNFVVQTPTNVRPPPRSVPADISDFVDLVSDSPASADFFVADIDELDLGSLELEWTPDSDDDESLPPTPTSPDSPSFYSEDSMPRIAILSELSLDAIPLEPATPAGSFFYIDNDDDDFRGAAIPDSPSVRPHDDFFSQAQPEKALRSRWSASTLAESFAERRGSGWRSRFAFAGGRKAAPSPTKSTFALRSPTRATFGLSKPAFGSPMKKSAASAPPAPGAAASSGTPSKRASAQSTAGASSSTPVRSPHARQLGRRDSNVSLCASDSGDSVCSEASTASNGLRRKPIPVEIFMRA
ncbi:hypothetical protein PsYK624_124920 [Phanerochaete sordida]|uniref:Uncharacterized protein n=1 Tax=Phanerochaete sordida TaxID=48140 RepID=A0A9P3LIL7_9APHY|nr:hypothetical protein PsYK624_124920 [Phanerochaete sordida]